LAKPMSRAVEEPAPSEAEGTPRLPTQAPAQQGIPTMIACGFLSTDVPKTPAACG
jgi:hypothetical protein